MPARADRKSRGQRLTERSKLHYRLGAWWVDSRWADLAAGAIVLLAGVLIEWLVDIQVVSAEARNEVAGGAVQALTALSALVLAVVSLAWVLRMRGRTLQSSVARTRLRKTWQACLIGSFLGVVAMIASWAVGVAFDWGWTGWTTLAAGVLVVARTGRAIVVLVKILDFAE